MENLVKKYNSVNIYVSPKGEFYCNVHNNSDRYFEKTFCSMKLKSIEKAIDDFNGEVKNGNQYYEIDTYDCKVKKRTVKRKVADRLFFDDGSDTSSASNQFMYPVEIENTDAFKELLLKVNECRKIENEMRDLYDQKLVLRRDIQRIKSNFKTSILVIQSV